MDDTQDSGANELEGQGAKVDDFQPPVSTAIESPHGSYKVYTSAQEFNNAELPKPVIPFSQRAMQSADNIISAFSGGMYDPTLQTGGLGLSDGTIAEMRKSGMFNDHAKGEDGFLKTVNEVVWRGGAAGLDATLGSVNRVFSGVLGSAGEGSQSALTEAGFPEAGQTAKQVIDFVGGGMYHAAAPIPGVAIPTALKATTADFGAYNPAVTPPLPEPVASARANAVIGEGEAGYMGTKETTPEDISAREQAAAQVTPEPSTANVTTGSPPDIHTVAREIDPDTFQEYDALAAKRDELRKQIDGLSEQRQQDAEASAPHGDAIAELQDKLANEQVNARQTARRKAKLDELITENDKHITDNTTGDTEGMAAARAALQQADYRMRDLSSKVSAAYRAAQERMPVTDEPAVEPAGVPQAQEVPTANNESVAKAVTETQAAEATNKTAAPIDEQKASIAKDVSSKLIAAGRPAEEADAASQLIAEHYAARSERFNGARGTAQEMYDHDGANIRSARTRASAREMAQRKGNSQPDLLEARLQSSAGKSFNTKQGEMGNKDSITQDDIVNKGELNQGARGKIRLATDDAKATITLMKEANASTFIHETGHHWLDEMLRDAKDEAAPADLLKDSQTVRKWLGADESGEITTRMHEKFARGFERYIMEGVAPSKALAGIFGKFKQWLTTIYQTVQRLKSPITDDIRDVFDRLITKNPEKTVIAPEREVGKMFADVHETDAESTPPERAAGVRDNIRRESDTVAKTNAPEVHNELSPEGAAGETRRLDDTGAQAGGDAVASESITGETVAPETSGTLGKGGSEAGQESGTARAKSAKNVGNGVYAKVPKKPLGLTDWIKKNGGIQDEGGDIRSTLGGAKYRPGLIRKNGKSADYLAMRAWEDGFFPEHTERPSVNEFLDKLNEDLKGNAQHSIHDESALDAHANALAHNKEVDNLAVQYGIDTAGKTKEQFWNEVADKSSSEDQARILSEMSESHKSEMEAFERKEQAWYESRGEAWEPIESQPRTLEDLENERKQENTSGEPQPGAENPEQSTGTERPEGLGAEAVGESQRDAGLSGRASAQSDFLNKDGSINPDTLNYNLYNNTPDWLQRYFNEYAQRNVGAFSSDVETLESMQRLTEATGWTPKEIQAMEIGQKQSRLQQLASAELFKSVVERVSAAAEKAASGIPEDIKAFFENTQDHELLMKLFKDQKEYSAEASRNLGIRRAIKNMGGAKAEQFAELFQRITDKTLGDVSKQASFLKELADSGEKGRVERFLKDGSETKWQRFKDGMATYYVNALISGPFTHIRYAIGNAVKVITKPLIVTPLQAASGAIRNVASLAMGKGEIADRVYLGEAGAQLYAMGKGARDGLSAAIEALKTGQSPLLPGEAPYKVRSNPIPGIAGTIITAPGRPISAIHSFFKSLRYEMELNGNAYRQAAKEGLQGEEFNRRVTDITQNPTDDMMQSAISESLKDIYMDKAKYGTFAYHLNAATQKSLMAKIVVPFMKIGLNITHEAFMESTPLGIVSENIRNNILGKNGGAARDMQLGKIAFGTSLIGVTSLMALEGNATGDGPADPKARAQWLLTHRPNTITVGDLTVPYQGLGSLGMLMRFSANMTETAKMWNEEDGTKLAHSFFEGITKSVLDDNWMRGVKDMMDAVYHPEEYGARYVQSMVTNWLPFSVGMGQISRMEDPWQRDIRSHGMENGFGILDAIKAKIPFISHDDLAERYDVFGQPIPNSGIRGYENDPVVQRMDALQVFPSKLGRKIRGVELTDQQYAEYSQMAGVLAKERLNQVVTQSGFTNLTPASQVNIINQTLKLYREQARGAIMMKYPDIMQKSTLAKRQDLYGTVH